MSYFVSASCKGEVCKLCGAPAVHKMGEEIPPDDPDQARHNLVAYVCREHFEIIFGHAKNYPEPFPLSLLDSEEKKKWNAWITNHDKTCRYAKPENQGASGGRLTYSFTPTSLGIVTEVRCTCGETVNLTDYKSW